MLKSPLLNFKDLTCVPVGYTTVLIRPQIYNNFSDFPKLIGKIV